MNCEIYNHTIPEASWMGQNKQKRAKLLKKPSLFPPILKKNKCMVTTPMKPLQKLGNSWRLGQRFRP